jgi:hypothetical protein
MKMKNTTTRSSKAPPPLLFPLSSRLTAKREEVNAALHMKQALSYRLFKPHFGGTVLLSDVWRIVAGAARNGATFDPRTDLGSLLNVDECAALTGMPRFTIHRILDKAPHFHLSNRAVLIKRDDFAEAVERRSVRRNTRRRKANAEAAAAKQISEQSE